MYISLTFHHHPCQHTNVRQNRYFLSYCFHNFSHPVFSSSFNPKFHMLNDADKSSLSHPCVLMSAVHNILQKHAYFQDFFSGNKVFFFTIFCLRKIMAQFSECWLNCIFKKVGITHAQYGLFHKWCYGAVYDILLAGSYLLFFVPTIGRCQE